MKLKDHVLKERRNIRVEKDNKKYVCRILQKGTSAYNVIAKRYGCTDNFFMDFTQLLFLKASRRYITCYYHPVFKDRRWFSFSSFEEAIKWLKDNGFKILPSTHRKLKWSR